MDNRANHPGDPRNTRTDAAASASTSEHSATVADAELPTFKFPVSAAAASSGNQDRSETTELISIDGSPMSIVHDDAHTSSPSSPGVAAVPTCKKEEDSPTLGDEQHIDEPEDLAWLRPLQGVQA